MTKGQIAKLIERSGSHVGREHVLKGDSIALGSGRSCGVVLKGRYVAERHAVLEHRGNGVWTISNQSVNGTFVNGEQVVSRNLSSGDSVRVGSETTLEFLLEAPPKREKKRRKQESVSGRPSILTQRPGLVVGIGAYLLGIVGLGFYLSGIDDKDDGTRLSPDLVQRVLEDSRGLLAKNLEPVTDDATSGGTGGPIDTTAEQAASYYRLIASKRRSLESQFPADTRDETDLIDAILDEVKGHLFRAWNLESQGRWKEAREAYGDALSVIPDIRIPAARLAAYRRHKLKEVMKR